MNNDISIYKDAQRNDPCPCGSGKTFKKCCMKEYRALKKRLSNAKLSCYTPLSPLTDAEKSTFTELYQDLLIYANQHQHGSDVVYIDDKNTATTQFIAQQRPYFYDNINAVIDGYINTRSPSEEQLSILNDLREAKFDRFFLLSTDVDSAIIMEVNETFYNVQALHSTFDTIFSGIAKYAVVQTALIAYKNCYITDGIYNVYGLGKEAEEYLDTIPARNPTIHYNKKNSITNIPLLLNLSLACYIDRFEAMEEHILKEIPHTFTQGLIDLFSNDAAYKVNFISSFFRATDLNHEFNSDEGDEAFSYLIGGTPVLNFEFGTKTDVISYDIVKKYYLQKPIEESLGAPSYTKAMSKDPLLRMVTSYSSFYSMLGILHIDEENIKAYEQFLDEMDSKENREKITTGLENLFRELSDKVGFEIVPVYLGSGIELDTIHHDIDEYRTYINATGIEDILGCQEYSSNRGE